MTRREKDAMRVISAMEEAGERPTLRAIAEALDVSQGRAAQLVRGLVREGVAVRPRRGTVSLGIDGDSDVADALQEATRLLEHHDGVTARVGKEGDRHFLRLSKEVEAVYAIGESGIPIAAAVTRGLRALREIPGRVGR